MSTRRFFRFVFSFISAGSLLTGAVACSSGGGGNGSDDGAAVEAPGVGDGSESTGAEAGSEAQADTDVAEDRDADDAGGSAAGEVTASYGPARGTASIDDIDEPCEWISTAEIEEITGSTGLDADGFGIPGMDLQCEYGSDDGRVWVQVAYTLVEPGLDLTEELSADIPTIEWVESLDGVGEQAVVSEGPMGSAQVDIVDGDLRVMANVILAGDAAAAQQAAVDVALLGIRADRP